MKTLTISRRRFLGAGAAVGAGTFAYRHQLQTAAATELRAVAPAGPHFRPQAKRLIKIFLTGGMSHVDTFDEKPLLKRDHGKTVDGPNLRGVSTQPREFAPGIS